MCGSAIGFQELSPALQKEVIDLQKRMAVELQPLVLESTLTMQKVLECPDHTARVQLVRSFVESEIKRLKTKKSIQGMFSGTASSSAVREEEIPLEERVSDEPATRNRPSSFFADEDAFQ